MKILMKLLEIVPAFHHAKRRRKQIFMEKYNLGFHSNAGGDRDLLLLLFLIFSYQLVSASRMHQLKVIYYIW